jgi:beta-galactosidase
MNEGGLYAERLDCRLPSAPQLPQYSSPLTGLSSSGIQFYSTTFHLNLDSNLDVLFSIALSVPAGTVARVMIWENGYQYGKLLNSSLRTSCD